MSARGPARWILAASGTAALCSVLLWQASPPAMGLWATLNRLAGTGDALQVDWVQLRGWELLALVLGVWGLCAARLGTGRDSGKSNSQGDGKNEGNSQGNAPGASPEPGPAGRGPATAAPQEWAVSYGTALAGAALAALVWPSWLAGSGAAAWLGAVASGIGALTGVGVHSLLNSRSPAAAKAWAWAVVAGAATAICLSPDPLDGSRALSQAVLGRQGSLPGRSFGVPLALLIAATLSVGSLRRACALAGSAAAAGGLWGVAFLAASGRTLGLGPWATLGAALGLEGLAAWALGAGRVPLGLPGLAGVVVLAGAQALLGLGRAADGGLNRPDSEA